MFHTKIFVLKVIEWTDERDESGDSRMTSKIEEEGRRMLRSSSRECALERIVKVGDPPSKMRELASPDKREKLTDPKVSDGVVNVV